jgi:predicted nucleotide-binding protein (sugar kinase/HSP70/actin superfamily)
MSAPFTKEMKKDHVLLIPDMLPIHFSLIMKVFVNHGYQAELLTNRGPNVIREGMRYVHNDICYPAQLVIGQFIDALLSGKYDTHKVALVITQTGGGCRASNYLFLLKKALHECKMDYIPVISLNLKGMDENPGFKLTPIMILHAYCGFVYGDLLMMVSNQVRPYEITKGQTDALVEKWIKIIGDKFAKNHGYIGWAMRHNFEKIVHEFAAIPVKKERKIKVGIVGEIYMKYSALGNNGLQKFLEDQGCEVMIPPLMDFLYYGIDNAQLDRHYYGHLFWASILNNFANHVAFMIEAMELRAMKQGGFNAPEPYRMTKAYDEGLIDFGVKMGEGWLLTAEMLGLVHMGFSNIICAQPFGCLPNHICAKGMFHAVRERVPQANIVPIDYDPSASHVNQENRIKLMLAIAQENLMKEEAAESKAKEG